MNRWLQEVPLKYESHRRPENRNDRSKTNFHIDNLGLRSGTAKLTCMQLRLEIAKTTAIISLVAIGQIKLYGAPPYAQVCA